MRHGWRSCTSTHASPSCLRPSWSDRPSPRPPAAYASAPPCTWCHCISQYASPKRPLRWMSSSGGRSIFGIGRGAIPGHFQGYRVDQEEARDRFNEGLEMVLGMWTHDDYSYSGKHHQVEGINLSPKPIQQPHPPVYIASNSPDTLHAGRAVGPQHPGGPHHRHRSGRPERPRDLPQRVGRQRPRPGAARREYHRSRQRRPRRVESPPGLRRDDQQTTWEPCAAVQGVAPPGPRPSTTRPYSTSTLPSAHPSRYARSWTSSRRGTAPTASSAGSTPAA